MELFFEIHSGLTREGPGCNSSTREAFSKISKMPHATSLLDVGCGPGIQSLELSTLLEKAGGRITATDVNEEYLNALRKKIEDEGATNITCEIANMFDLHYEDDAFDIVWAEGAIFIIGFQEGLTGWRRVLKPGGVMAVTELSWIEGGAPEDVVKFWGSAYPGMKTVEENLDIARGCGFDIEAHFTLPESAWFTDYYIPLERKIDSLKDKYAGNSAAIEQLDEAMIEIDLYKEYSAYYGYEFYILKSNDA